MPRGKSESTKRDEAASQLVKDWLALVTHPPGTLPIKIENVEGSESEKYDREVVVRFFIRGDEIDEQLKCQTRVRRSCTCKERPHHPSCPEYPAYLKDA